MADRGNKALDFANEGRDPEGSIELSDEPRDCHITHAMVYRSAEEPGRCALCALSDIHPGIERKCERVSRKARGIDIVDFGFVLRDEIAAFLKWWVETHDWDPRELAEWRAEFRLWADGKGRRK